MHQFLPVLKTMIDQKIKQFSEKCRKCRKLSSLLPVDAPVACRYITKTPLLTSPKMTGCLNACSANLQSHLLPTRLLGLPRQNYNELGQFGSRWSAFQRLPKPVGVVRAGHRLTTDLCTRTPSGRSYLRSYFPGVVPKER